MAQEFALLADVIRFHAQAEPERKAIIDGQAITTYRQLDERMDRVACALQRDGIAPQDAIAICAATSSDYIALFLGALRAGIAVSPLAPSSTPESLASMVADCAARIYFTDKTTTEVSAKVDPAVRRIMLEDKSFEDWLAPAGSLPKRVDVKPSDAFNIIYSSGTTGTPKGIVQSHRMRWLHVQRGGVFRYDTTAVTMVSTPLYSNTTLVSVFPALAGGGALVLLRKFDAALFLKLAEQHQATHAMLVPVQYHRIMALPDFDRHDLTQFRMKFCTSAPFAAALKSDVLKRWPGGLIEYYGMTEGGGTCILVAHEFPNKVHTVGKPAEGHEILLIDDQGQILPQGETGEVVGCSRATMNGYHNQPGKTSEAQWVHPDGRVFIRTGDVGRFDEDGFLTLMDRKKDMIISGGFNIYPSDLEAVLQQNPAIADVAVVGVPSETWGETPVAFVVRAQARKTVPRICCASPMSVSARCNACPASPSCRNCHAAPLARFSSANCVINGCQRPREADPCSSP